MTTTLRNTIARVSMALGAVCLFGMSLQAQDYAVKANVPFEFKVDRTVMPAGTYRVDSTEYTLVARIRNVKTSQKIFVRVGTPEPTPSWKSPCLLFHRYGSEAFLAEIRTPSGISAKVPTTRREKELMMGSTPVATILIPMGVRAD